jgi:membrane protein implicated in regulation of membrane protease activity
MWLARRFADRFPAGDSHLLAWKARVRGSLLVDNRTKSGRVCMENYIYWFLLALILVGLEMATGTFYLLMVAIAIAAGGLVALLGATLRWQLMLSALMVIVGTIVLRRWKSGQVEEDVSASLDVGQPVRVIKWNDNHSARVLYRGAEWDAVPESADTPHDETLYIAAIRGSGLVLTHRKLPQH